MDVALGKARFPGTCKIECVNSMGMEVIGRIITHLLPTPKRNTCAHRRERTAASTRLFRAELESGACSLEFVGSLFGQAQILGVIWAAPEHGDDSRFLVNKWARITERLISR